MPTKPASTPAHRPAPGRPRRAAEGLLRIERHLGDDRADRLAADVRDGLAGVPKRLPPKYFYDARGSELFEAICELPEYYLTRIEHALLAAVADEVIGLVRPTQLIELGSGASRKTRLLLDALTRRRAAAAYVPIDVSETALRRAAAVLRRRYPKLRVHGMVADYEHSLPPLPPAKRRLAAFLGSTIGNFVVPTDATFLRAVRARLAPGDHLLLGVDLVKSAAVLHAAYNDAAGVTAEFNRNILRVLNRELRADFDPARFDHVAFFDPAAAQIEMHLRAREAHVVRIGALDLAVPFAAGETIHTESSRKFTRAGTEQLLAGAGFRPVRWFAAPRDAFGLALARVEADA